VNRATNATAAARAVLLSPIEENWGKQGTVRLAMKKILGQHTHQTNTRTTHTSNRVNRATNGTTAARAVLLRPIEEMGENKERGV